MITQKIKKYDCSKLNWETADDAAISTTTFAVTFKAIPAELDGPLLVSPALKVTVENKSEKNYIERHFNKCLQNYFSVNSPDGSCRVIEAAFSMICDWQPWKIGFPLALLKDQHKEHEFTLLFDGTYFNILCDGEVMDREAPEGNGPEHNFWRKGQYFNVCCRGVRDLRLANDLSRLEWHEESVSRDIPVAYYTPYGFNTWIGDVVTFAHEGIFHIFYLHDRRHHQSRRGKGAHEFWHMTSTDLKNWTDHGPVMELAEPWQTTGTGNAFVFNGKLHLAFGWHTERSIPWNQRADQLLMIHLNQYGESGEFTYAQIGNLIPAGASYLYSEDGINFTPSGKLMHYIRNPSIFPQPDGTLHLYQDGKWESDHLGNWRQTDPDFPRRGKNSFSRNCLDCPTFFSLDGWDYFAVGFTGFFGKPASSKEWIDFTEKGWEPYDGACVPMASEFNGRLIEGSWPDGNGWGSCLLLRELIPLGSGRIGKRWIPETLPAFGEIQIAEREFDLPECIYCLVEIGIDPADGIFTILFTGKAGETPVEFMLDPAAGKAQWSGEPGKKVKTLREKMLEHPEYSSFRMFSDIHCGGRDYAREELIGLDSKFSLKLLICRDPKFNTTLIDAELGGKHTLLTNRNDLHAQKIIYSGNAKTPKLKISSGNISDHP